MELTEAKKVYVDVKTGSRYEYDPATKTYNKIIRQRTVAPDDADNEEENKNNKNNQQSDGDGSDSKSSDKENSNDKKKQNKKNKSSRSNKNNDTDDGEQSEQSDEDSTESGGGEDSKDNKRSKSKSKGSKSSKNTDDDDYSDDEDDFDDSDDDYSDANDGDSDDEDSSGSAKNASGADDGEEDDGGWTEVIQDFGQKLSGANQETNDDGPDIGRVGDEAIQAAERAKRLAQIAKEAAEDALADNPNATEEEKAEIAKKASEKAIEEASRIIQDIKGENGEVSDGILLRGQKLINILRSQAVQKAVQQDMDDIARKEVLRKAVQDARNSKKVLSNKVSNNLQSQAQFSLDIQRYVKDAVKEVVKPSLMRQNRTYAMTNIIKPGKKKVRDAEIPTFQFYIDQSGSWGQDDLIRGLRTVESIMTYVKKKQISLTFYAFGTRVVDATMEVSPDGKTQLKVTGNHGGSTYGEPIIEHIKKTNPKNVIIMTDSDIRDIREGIQIPGAVFLIFNEGKTSSNLIDNIYGVKQTSYYRIDD